MIFRGLALQPSVQGFLVLQAWLALALGAAYVGWTEGEPALRYLALSDFAGGTAPQADTLLGFKLIVGLATLWFGYVGLLALLGCATLRAAIAASVRAALLNLPALAVMGLLEMLADMLQESLPRSLPYLLAGIAFSILLLALSAAAAYASFRDIFRPADATGGAS